LCGLRFIIRHCGVRKVRRSPLPSCGLPAELYAKSSTPFSSLHINEADDEYLNDRDDAAYPEIEQIIQIAAASGCHSVLFGRAS
jgi:hypothetical protein